MQDELLTVKEACTYLQVSETTMRRLIARRALPGMRMLSHSPKRTRWRLSRPILEAWVSGTLAIGDGDEGA